MSLTIAKVDFKRKYEKNNIHHTLMNVFWYYDNPLWPVTHVSVMYFGTFLLSAAICFLKK